MITHTFTTGNISEWGCKTDLQISASDKTTKQGRINMLTHTRTRWSTCTDIPCLPLYSETALLTNQHKFCIQNYFSLSTSSARARARAHAQTRTQTSTAFFWDFVHTRFSPRFIHQCNSTQPNLGNKAGRRETPVSLPQCYKSTFPTLHQRQRKKIFSIHSYESTQKLFVPLAGVDLVLFSQR